MTLEEYRGKINPCYGCGCWEEDMGCAMPSCDKGDACYLEDNGCGKKKEIDDIPHTCMYCANGYYTDTGFKCDQAHYHGESDVCLGWKWDSEEEK